MPIPAMPVISRTIVPVGDGVAVRIPVVRIAVVRVTIAIGRNANADADGHAGRARWHCRHRYCTAQRKSSEGDLSKAFHERTSFGFALPPTDSNARREKSRHDGLK